MNEILKKILQLAQEHSDLAFEQGYQVAIKGIALHERHFQSAMPVALKRAMKFEELAKAVEKLIEKVEK